MGKKKDGGKNREKWSPSEIIQISTIFKHGSSDSMAGLIPIHQTLDEISSPVRDFNSILMEGLDEDLDEYGVGQISEKKRRLSVDQVKALEKNFDSDNKLEPERKVKLAHELALQPRQVAVWFQNRRARWKTKQLEKDYGVLKANFDSLKHNFDSLKQDNESVLKQIMELKFKLYGEDEESDIQLKEESDDKPNSPEKMVETAYFPDLKDGSSDSDSSAILNELTESKAVMGDAQKAYQPQFVKIEEHDFLDGDGSCNFFSDDQAPMLQWYCHDQWNLGEEN